MYSPEDIQYDSSGPPEHKQFLFSSHTNVYIYLISNPAAIGKNFGLKKHE